MSTKGKFKLFWRFVFFVRPVGLGRFSLPRHLPILGRIPFPFLRLGADSVPIAYREDALWLYQEDRNNWVLIDRQRIDFRVTRPQGGVTYRRDYAEFNNGYLKATARTPNTISTFLEPYNVTTYPHNGVTYTINPEEALCVSNEYCPSKDGIFIEAEVAIEPQSKQNPDIFGTILPIFWMTNNNNEDNLRQAYGIYEVVDEEARRILGATISGSQYIPGTESAQDCSDPTLSFGKSVSFDPGRECDRLQLTEIERCFHRLQLTETERCFQMTVDSIPLASLEKPQQLPNQPRHCFLTNPDEFYIGAFYNDAEGPPVPLQQGRIRRVVFDPTNPCWSCGD